MLLGWCDSNPSPLPFPRITSQHAGFYAPDLPGGRFTLRIVEKEHAPVKQDQHLQEMNLKFGNVTVNDNAERRYVQYRSYPDV